MIEFALALGTFLIVHVLPAQRGLRAGLVRTLGERGYLLAYSVVSLLLMVWVILAAGRAPYVELWPSVAWTRWAALVVMPIALIFVVTGAVTPNPLSVAFRREGYRIESPGIVAVTRHPILWGFALWAVVHLLVNGDLISVILFAGLALFSFIGMIRLDQKKRTSLGETAWRALSGGTSSVPLGAILTGRAAFPTDRRTLGAALVALLIYAALLLQGHLALFGADPLAGLG